MAKYIGYQKNCLNREQIKINNFISLAHFILSKTFKRI